MFELSKIDRLDQLTDDVAARQSKLILLIGASGAHKSAMLAALSERRSATVLNVGLELGTRLNALPMKTRGLAVPGLMRELSNSYASNGLLLVDNIEVLFDRNLMLSALNFLKQVSSVLRVVAVWPGEFRAGRLIYADFGHPEHLDCGTEGIVLFQI